MIPKILITILLLLSVLPHAAPQSTERSEQQQKIDALREEAKKLYYANESEQALRIFREALSLAETIHDTERAVRIHTNMSLLLEGAEAEKEHLSAITGLESLKELTDNLLPVLVWNNYGQWCIDQGKYEEAVEKLGTALNKLSAWNPADKNEWLSYKARISANMGDALSKQERYKEARAYFDSALEIFATKLPVSDQTKQMLAQCYLMHANCEQRGGEIERAIRDNKKAERLYKELKDATGVARVQHNLANCYVRQYLNSTANAKENLDKTLLKEARDLLTEALKYFTEQNHQKDQEYALYNLANIDTLLGENQNALKNLRESLALAKQSGKHLTSAQMAEYEFATASIMLDAQDFDQSLQLTEKSIHHFGNAPSSALAYAYFQKGIILENLLQSTKHKEQRKKEAQRWYTEAEEAYRHVCEITMKRANEAETKDHFLSNKTQNLGDAYSRRARLAIMQGLALPPSQQQPYFQRALELMEAGKDWSLAKQSVQYSFIFSQMYKKKYDRVRQLRTKLDTLQETYDQSEGQNAALRLPLITLQNQFHTALAALPTPPQIENLLAHRTFAELEANLKPQTLYVAYLVPETGKSYLLAIEKSKPIHVLLLPAQHKEIAQSIQEWRSTIDAKRRTLDTHEERKNIKRYYHQANREPQAVQRVSQMILAPLFQAGILRLTKPSQYDHIVFIGERALLNIPFAALSTQTHQDEKQPLPYTSRLVNYFATSLTTSIANLRGVYRANPPSSKVLCFTDPFGITKSDSRSQTISGLSALKYAREMGVNIKKINSRKTTYITGSLATKSSLLSQITQCETIILGIHGEVNGRNGLRSKLYFAPEKGENEPSVLEAREVAEYALSAKLAMLIACESGQGTEQYGEGLVGIAWAFRAAGCPSIIATHWKVLEDSTTEIAFQFYSQYVNRKPMAIALKNAIQTYLQRNNTPQNRYKLHPYYWAGISLLGN